MCSQDFNPKGALETSAQINAELKRTGFDGAFWKKIKFLTGRFVFLLNVENRSKKESIERKIGVTERPISLSPGRAQYGAFFL